ncbi:MAG: rod shape-determining protein MreC [Paludibacter sp.]|jgi:rod shape-determining protein MreC|nr:rod shape-determining protein MreC [Paludibacter sp.]
MHNFFNFFVRFGVTFLFLALEIAAFVMIIRSQSYQRSVFLSSSNSVVAELYSASNNVVEFFKLKAANDNLSEENTLLKNEIIQLRNQLAAFHNDSIAALPYTIAPEMEYKLISAKVINNSTNKLQNYITINKGRRDNIRADMGVISDEGVVGIVSAVSDKFAVIIPVLNDKLTISSKFVKNSYSGPLTWTGYDYRFATLGDIARHVEFTRGDTLVTSGYTSSFPEGIPVGTIDDFKIAESDSYYTIKVRLAVNFRTLSHVKVIDYANFNEQKTLEETKN